MSIFGDRKKHRRIRCCALLLSLIFLMTGCGGSGDFRVGTGDEGGTYYQYTEKMIGLLGEDFSFQLKSTAGSKANLRLLQKGFLDLAIVQSDELAAADKGEGTFSGDAFANGTNYSAVTALYTEALQIVVKKDSDIRTSGDLKGRRVSVGEQESGVRKNAQEILRMSGMTEKDIEVSYLSFTDAAEALKKGEIDAFFCVAGVPTGAVADLAKETEIRILSLEEQSRIIMNLYPHYRECTIPAQTYAGQTEEIRTIGVRAVLVASNQLDDAKIKKLTEKILANSGELNQSIATDGALTPKEATEGVTIPFHPGAAEYLQEQGVSVSVEQSKDSETVFGGQDAEGGGK